MPRPDVLSDDDLAAALGGLPRWAVVDGKLHREYRFDDFARAIGFMTAVATTAERIDHHPEWVNVYNRVTVDLVTHDAGGITALDVELARRMDELAGG